MALGDTNARPLQRVFHYSQPMVKHDIRAELLQGLRENPKSIAPKYFYDTRGSELFEKITQLDEYYPTRTEKLLLSEHAAAIAQCVGEHSVLVEPGSGSSEKVEILLPAVRPDAYVPIEISEAPLRAAAERLAESFPWLQVHAVCADYSDNVALPDAIPSHRNIVFYPGSTIGNFEPDEAIYFLQRLCKLCGDDGGLLIGVDLQKDPDLLEAAYNDTRGVTAEFNLNVLRHINRVAAADFDPAAFRHDAVYNVEQGRIEMYLESERQQRVTVAGESIEFARNERVLTEYSCKYTVESFQKLATAAGFEPVQCWTDSQQLFSVHFFNVASSRDVSDGRVRVRFDI